MRAAVILSGCGHLDGAEIREAVLSLLTLDRLDVACNIFAPDRPQTHVVNHLRSEVTTGERNILEESARIARGDIQPLSKLVAEAYDLLVIPGGYGVAKNYSNLAFQGADCLVEEDFSRVVKAFYTSQKPIVAICIAPAVLAAALRNQGITLTIGDDAATAKLIQQFGNMHQNCGSDGMVLDTTHRIVSCSAYMRNDRISVIASGIEQAIRAGVALASESSSKAA